MNVNCVICSDFLTPTAEVYVTKCGHMFHYTCLMNWIERKKTCPHCRHSVTEKTILRVYFNVADVDGVHEDYGTLVNKVENLQFQITINQKDIKIYKNKAKSLSDTNAGLRQEVAELESKLRTYESTIHALKDQISFFKSKSKETDRLNSEIVKLKQTIKGLQNVQLAVSGSKEQVCEMIRTEDNAESLAILAVTLKKSLLDVEKSKRELGLRNTRLQNEYTTLKRELSESQSQNSHLKKEIESLKINFQNEKKYLKNKIIDLGKELPPNEIIDKSLDRIIFESPVNFNKSVKFSSSNASAKKRSITSIEDEPISIQDKSPCLFPKANPVFQDFNDPNLGLVNTTSKSGFSIFKSSHHKGEEIKLPVKTRTEFYDGLGGSSKEDIFPSPKPAKVPLKRPKTTSGLSSNKMKKLAPLNIKSTVKDFFPQT